MRSHQQLYTLRSFKAPVFITCLWVILTAAGCRKIDPIKYEGKDVLYFLNARESGVDYDSLLTGKLKDTLVLSFFQRDIPEDTFYLIRHDENGAYNKRGYDALRVRLAGFSKPVDRKFSVTITGSGSRYCMLPPADALKIAAGTRVCPLDLRLLRPPVTDTSTYSVTVSLVDNEYFTPTLHKWHQFQCVFGNIVEQPNQGWSGEWFGTFSREKLMAMLEAINQAAPAVKQKLQQDYFSMVDPEEFPIPPVFEPFTLNSLYLFLNQIGYGRDSKHPYFKTFAGITKDYLGYRKRQGNPVLDSNGQEVQFP